jgi:hypothetical protein
MTSHTPGPWIWRGKSSSLHQEGDNNPSPYGPRVLTLASDEYTDAEISDADATLIAASPDLLAACKAAVACLDHATVSMADADEMLHAAIKKAEGEEGGE